MKGTSSLMPSVSSGWWRNATVPASVHHQSRGTPASGGSATIEGAVTVLHPRHLDRRRVHELSRQIDATYVDHDRAVQALLVRHARLTCFVRDSLPASPQDDEARGVAVAFLGVVLRIVDLVGGTVREVRSKDLRDARRRVAERAAGGDQGAEGLVARARSVTRAQPHLLDEILHVLVEATPADSLLTDHDRRRVYALLWIAVEAIDARWTPPATLAHPTHDVRTAAPTEGMPPRAGTARPPGGPAP